MKSAYTIYRSSWIAFVLLAMALTAGAASAQQGGLIIPGGNVGFGAGLLQSTEPDTIGIRIMAKWNTPASFETDWTTFVVDYYDQDGQVLDTWTVHISETISLASPTFVKRAFRWDGLTATQMRAPYGAVLAAYHYEVRAKVSDGVQTFAEKTWVSDSRWVF